MANGEIVQRALFTDDQLRGIQSWEDINALFAEKELSVTNVAEVLGTGFSLFDTDDKNKLCGVPLMILDWRFNVGDMGTFVSLTVAYKSPDGGMGKVIVNDGSTGICAQIESLTNRGITAPLMVPNGFVRSDYDYEDVDKNGKKVMRPATTYYLSESA